CELLRVARPDFSQPLFKQPKGLFPRDRLELARAALRSSLPPERPRQPRRRVLLHDPRRALRADHALVQRMMGIAVDVAHPALAQMHADAAAARAHVAGGGLYLGVQGG